MNVTEERYQKALQKIGYARMLSLPDSIKTILKEVTDLETKTKMLEEIAARI